MEVTAMGVFIGKIFTYSAFAYPTVFPTGVTIYKPDRCWNGYTLCPDRGAPVLLIDMNGNVVHRWDVSTSRARLLTNGHLVIEGKTVGFHRLVGEDGMTAKMRKFEQIENLSKKILEYDWDGNLVWEYEAPGATHHDLHRLPNGNTIFLYMETVPEEYMKLVKDSERRASGLRGDCICEVNPKKEVVWEWHEYKHLDLNAYSSVDGLRDWTHTNTVQVFPENRWYAEGHKEFKPGNVLINPRNLDTCIIIDRETKEVVWSYTGDYKGGIAHSHEPHMIGPNLPGAGNILIFDNGIGVRGPHRWGRSFVLEINPVTKEIVRKYEKGKGLFSGKAKFFSGSRGSQQRLPNGNTLIDESNEGRIFEVTPKGKIVWEYITPPFQDSSHRPCSLRPKRYSYDYCPQLKALSKPKELAVTPPKYKDFHLLPDAVR